MEPKLVKTINDKLTEGETFRFEVVHRVRLPDNEDYYVLKDPQGIRHLLKHSYYRDYEIKVPSVIDCRVDKISCSGRIHLEPRHPNYQEGSAYEFDFMGITNIVDQEGRAGAGIIVRDLFGNEWVAKPGPRELPAAGFSGRCLCRISLIKKGKLFLEFDPGFHPK